MNKILVPIDGSDCSGRAIDMAAELAGLYGSELVLIHVSDNQYMFAFTSDYYSSAFQVTLLEDYQKNMELAASRLLAEAKERCQMLGDRVKTEALEGRPADTIIEYVKKNAVDLVVIGSHGVSGFKRFFIGSVTNKVALSIDKPVLIVK